jgi:signal transduction histidine kinase
MDRCGRFSIAAENRSVPAGDRTGLPAGDYIVLSLADTGCGMSPEVAARAFDPFFTTKEVGKGTGLGLSQVYAFAQHSGGTALIESSEGRGTTVHLYLPRADAVVVNLPPADPAGKQSASLLARPMAGQQLAAG